MTEWVDLSRPFDADAEHGTTPPPEFEQLATSDADGARVQWLATSTHTGTHVDAPRHVLAGGATIDDLSLDRFAGEGVVVDVERDEPGPIDAGALAAAADGLVADREVVLLRTGWTERYGTADYDPYPWLAPDAGEWLLDRDVRLLGVDTRSPDRPRSMRSGDREPYPVHRVLLDAGVPIAENLRLPRPLVGERMEVIAFPLAVRDGDGAPARIVARR